MREIGKYIAVSALAISGTIAICMGHEEGIVAYIVAGIFGILA
jgi:hypothetical protein